MMETWLRPNRRVLAVLLAGSLILTGIAVWLLRASTPLYFWYGAWLFPLAVVLSLGTFFRMFRRRLAYRSGTLLIGLGPPASIPVPIDAVECFFLGSSQTRLSGRWGLQSRAVSIVVRLAERATEYHNRTVQPRLGTWSEGYITIRGSWCEPVSPALVAKLNQRLTEAQRAMYPERHKEK